MRGLNEGLVDKHSCDDGLINDCENRKGSKTQKSERKDDSSWAR
jgi:hypothetical protein